MIGFVKCDSYYGAALLCGTKRRNIEWIMNVDSFGSYEDNNNLNSINIDFRDVYFNAHGNWMHLYDTMYVRLEKVQSKFKSGTKVLFNRKDKEEVDFHGRFSILRNSKNVVFLRLRTIRIYVAGCRNFLRLRTTRIHVAAQAHILFWC